MIRFVDRLAKALDKHMADLDVLLSYADIRKEVIWVEDNYSGGGALHLPIEDGESEDTHIQYHIDNMESGVWDGYASDVKIEDRPRFLELAYSLIKLKSPYRELIINGVYLTEDLFDHIYNGEEI